MSEPESVDVMECDDPITDAATLGVPVLAQIVEGMADGILLVDEDQRCVYVNPGTCRMLGRPSRDLLGYGYEQVIPPQDLVAARDYFAAVLGGSTELVTQMLLDADGKEREVVHASFRVDVGGRRYGGALVRDFTESRAAGRAAAALAQSAAELVGDASVNDILSSIARHAVEGTRAVWAGVAVVGEAGTVAFAGGYGPDGAEVGSSSEAYRLLLAAPVDQFLDAMTAGAIRAGDAPTRAVTLTRSTWERDPVLSIYGRAVLKHSWQSAVSVPVAYDNRVIGALVVLVPSGTTVMDDAEIAFCTALADHAGMAVANERLSRQTARSAELRERGRVARELHDSVSQALFAMTMHARTAQLALTRTGLAADTPLAESLEQLSSLSRGALAEMRALIFELRPEALAVEGLVRALKTQAAAIAVREHVTITIDGPAGRLPLDTVVEAELYRIVSELVHAAVTSAGDEILVVQLHVEEQQLTITVPGAGVVAGSSAAQARSRLAALTERARTIGGVLSINDVDRSEVSVVLPLPDVADRVGAVR